jgi:hypothetical protein
MLIQDARITPEVPKFKLFAKNIDNGILKIIEKIAVIN